MNKKIFLYLMILTFITVQQVFAVPSTVKMNVQKDITIEDSEKSSEADIIKRFSLRNKFTKSPEAQIDSFLKKYNHYSETNNFKKLKEMYSDSFVNNDGFDKETVFKMMEAVAGVYKNTKYNTEIKKITINGNYAIVEAHETATAEADNVTPKFNDAGLIVSEIDYIDYLVKEGRHWKIQATYMLTEEVSMKYGEAKNMNIKIISPESISAGTPYEVTVQANNPDGTFAVGSIVNEQIIFPQKDNQDVFRALKNEKVSRVLTSNTNNRNEYVTTSIALTRAAVQPNAININMTGMVLAMKRVNVMPFTQQKKDEVVSE